MNFFFLPALLLVVSLFLYVWELMEDHPDGFRAAIYALAMVVSFVAITLNLKDVMG